MTKENGVNETQAKLETWLLAGFLAIVLLGSAAVALAETYSSTDSDGKLTITKEPCTKAGPWFAKWKAATWLYRGKQYDACWTVAGTRGGGQTIVVFDSDGQVSQIPPERFRPDEGV